MRSLLISLLLAAPAHAGEDYRSRICVQEAVMAGTVMILHQQGAGKHAILRQLDHPTPLLAEMLTHVQRYPRVRDDRQWRRMADEFRNIYANKCKHRLGL